MFLTSPKIGSSGKKVFHWCVPISEPAELSRDKVAFQIHCEVAFTNTPQSFYLLTFLYWHVTILLHDNCQNKYRFPRNMLGKYPPFFFFSSYNLKGLVCISCYQRSICVEFQGCCVCFTFETEHQSLLNPRTPLGPHYLWGCCLL